MSYFVKPLGTSPEDWLKFNAVRTPEEEVLITEALLPVCLLINETPIGAFVSAAVAMTEVDLHAFKHAARGPVKKTWFMASRKDLASVARLPR